MIHPSSTTISFKTKAGLHCLKSLQIRSYFWSLFSRIRTEYGEIRSIEVSLRIQSECGKYGPEITPYVETFHAVLGLVIVIIVFDSDRTSSSATLLNYLHIMYQSIFHSFSSDFFTYQINFSVLWPVWALRSLESCVSYLPSCFCFYTFFWMLWMVITVNKFSL